MVKCPQICLLCRQSPQTRTWSHLSCLSILAWSYRDSTVPSRDGLLSYGTATRPRWREPRATTRDVDSSFDHLSVKFFSRVLQNMFSDELVKRLPQEIFLEIMELLGPARLSAIRECRFLIGRIRREPLGTKIPLEFSCVVYGKTLCFRGNSYISTITHRPNERGGLRKLRGRLRTDACRVAISFDEIGVRNIRIFGPGVSTIPADGSPWYYIVDSSSQVVFEGSTDVSLRIACPESSDAVPGSHPPRCTS